MFSTLPPSSDLSPLSLHDALPISFSIIQPAIRLGCVMNERMNRMPARAEIITVGTELLLGEIIDTNAAHLSRGLAGAGIDRKSTRLNSSHVAISYAVFCLKKKTHV